MANAGTVNINLVAETAQFVANINKAVSTLKYLKAAEVAFDKGKELAGWMAQQIQYAKEYSKAGTAVADALDRQAQSLGTTAKAMAAFAVVEHRADLEAGALASSLSKMQVAIQESSVYGSSAEKAFARLGLRFSDLAGLSPEEQFRMISDGVSKLSSNTERASIANDIFGKAYKGLVGTLAQGRAAFDDAALAAQKFGLALSATEQARILKAEEKVKELALVIKGYQQQVAAANAENVAAEAAYAAKVEKENARIAKAANESISWVTRIKAAFRDAAESAEKSGGSWSPSAAALKSSREWTDTVEGAAKGVRDAGVEAKRTEDLTSGMLKVFTDFERKFNASGESARASIARDAEITKKQADITKDLNKERLEWLKPTVDAYEGMRKFWDKWYGDMGKARKEASDKAFSSSGFDFVRGEYTAEIKRMEEFRKKSAADDPRVREAVARRQIGGSQKDPAIAAELERIAAQRIAVEQAMGDPSQDPEVLYRKKVDLLLQEEAIRTDEEKRKRLENEANVQRAAYSEFFGNLSTIAGEFADQSKEMFLISQVASIAQAEVNAWMAYSNILANESLKGGIISAQLMAGVALAAGQVAVMNIARQKPPGRANGGAVTRNSLYEVAEKGPEILESGGRSYLLNGDKSGRVQPMGPGGGSGVVVNVNNLPGQTARVSEGGTPDQPTITIDIIDGMMASAASQPRGQFSRAMQSRYGLNAARGAQ